MKKEKEKEEEEIVLPIGISPTAKYAKSVTFISLTKKKNHNHNHDNNNNNHAVTTTIQIQIQIQSQCLHPYFMVRLAGPALIGMDKMQHFHLDHSKISGVTYYDDDNDDDEPQIQFLYKNRDINGNNSNTSQEEDKRNNGTLTEITLQPVAVSGIYDVEIIQLLCTVKNPIEKKIDRQCIPNRMDTMMLNTPQQVYLEQTTTTTTTTNVNDSTTTTTTTSTTTTGPTIGHWELLGDDNVEIPTNTIRTRFQLHGDVRDKRIHTFPDQVTCTPTTSGSNCDNWWYEEYDFVGQDTHHLELLLLLQKNRQFCFLGDSHNLRLTYAFESLFHGKHKLYNNNKNDNNDNNNDNNITVTDISIVYPNTFFSSEFLEKRQQLVSNCTDVIIAMGQWPLSLLRGSRGHYHPDKWIQEISKIVDFLYNMHTNNNNNNKKTTTTKTVNIILRSIHYIPLGFIRTSCPPQDWRMPFLVDVYNERLRHLSKTHPAFAQETTKNFFIDTNPILGPVWDTASDYNHNSLKESIPEAIYLLQQMMIKSGEYHIITDGDKNESSSSSMTTMKTLNNHKSAAAAAATSSSVAIAETRDDYYIPNNNDVISQQTQLIIFVWLIIAFFILGKSHFFRRDVVYAFRHPSL